MILLTNKSFKVVEDITSSKKHNKSYKSANFYSGPKIKIKLHSAPIFPPAPPNHSTVLNITDDHVRLYWDVL